jgi:hypothetical protein
LENDRLRRMKDDLESEELRLLDKIAETKREEQSVGRQLNDTKGQLQKLEAEIKMYKK